MIGRDGSRPSEIVRVHEYKNLWGVPKKRVSFHKLESCGTTTFAKNELPTVNSKGEQPQLKKKCIV